MSEYLIIAHQTATCEELVEAVQGVLREGDIEFVLLVPETPVEDLLDWQTGDSKTIARRTAETAKVHLEEIGARITRSVVGDASPLKAIADELESSGTKFVGIIVCTLPMQRSRWLSLDQPRRIERRFGIPVTHVIAHSLTSTREELVEGLNEDLNLELETLLRSIYHAA